MSNETIEQPNTNYSFEQTKEDIIIRIKKSAIILTSEPKIAKSGNEYVSILMASSGKDKLGKAKFTNLKDDDHPNISYGIQFVANKTIFKD